MENAYPNLISFVKFDKGTHFAAWSRPDLFVGAMREGLDHCAPNYRLRKSPE